LEPTIVEIGKPGKFDPTFGLMKAYHPALMEPLYVIVWKDSGEQVLGTGGFVDPISAENYVKENRNKMVDKEFEQKFLR
jgi:hypothetical protein